MQNNNKKNDIMFDVYRSWSRGDKFSLRKHLSSEYQEKDKRIKAKYEVIEGEVKEVQND
tara:strand:+ start:147 stop:323 length:177 start_codon:yes stop_codon:yes gene_type:complete